MILKMKYKQFIYLLIGLVLPMLSYADDGMQKVFDTGNQQYAKGQYKEAIADYKKVLDAGYQSTAVFFNLGNASYKDGDIASALLYYEKARKLSPGDEDINFNIQFTNLKTTDKVDDAPEFFLAKWWRSFILMSSGTALAVWSILLVSFASLLFIVYLFTRSVMVKKISFYSAFVLFFFGLCTIFIAGRQVSYFDNHHQAIIFSGSVDVKSSPASTAKTLFVIHEGTKVDVVESNTGWTKIRMPNGNVGWIGVSDAKGI